jgi:hypothetical protein
MPHFKCVGCRTRLYSAARPVDLVGDLCPGCGSLLEPVGKLAEIVGFQSIKHLDSAVDGGRAGRHDEGIAGRVDDLFARSEEIRAQARLDARRSLDDGGFGPAAVAEAIVLPIPANLDDRRR